MLGLEAATLGAMGAPSRFRCPICGREAGPRPENGAFPFCSPACKLVDLGRWLEGSYRVPGPPMESSFSEDGGSAFKPSDEPEEDE